MGRIAKLLSFTRTLLNGANVTDVKADPGGGANITAPHFSAPGDDAFPLPGDYPFLAEDVGEGTAVAVGYVDPKNAQKAEAGEKRTYARDPSTGEAVVEFWQKADSSAILENENGHVELRADGSAILKNEQGFIELRADGGSRCESPAAAFDVAADGSIDGRNENGYFTLQTGGTFEVNNVTIDPSGNIDTPVNLNVGGTATAPTVAASSSLTAAGKEIVNHNHPAGSPPGNTGPNN